MIEIGITSFQKRELGSVPAANSAVNKELHKLTPSQTAGTLATQPTLARSSRAHTYSYDQARVYRESVDISDVNIQLILI